MSCQICLDSCPKMICGHYAHIECLRQWRGFRYKCLECGKDIGYPSFLGYNILFLFLSIVITCILLNNLYTENLYIDEHIENSLIIEYETLLYKIFSKKVEIQKIITEENELYQSYKIVLYRLKYIEKLKLINNSSAFQKILYLFDYYNSQYQDLKN